MIRSMLHFGYGITLLATVVLLHSVWLQTAHAKITANMELKKNVVRLGETTTLEITIQADEGEALSAPEIPEYKWALVERIGQTQTQNFSVINGRMSSIRSLKLTYKVTPLETGQYAVTNIRESNSSKTIQPVRITIL